MKKQLGTADVGLNGSIRHKLVVVGDGNSGKTSLLVTYVNNAFPEIYVPTIFETHVVEVQVNDQKVPMVLWDTAGQENYDMLRPISYPGTDVFIVCFSIENPDSFNNVTNKWIPEVRHFSRTVPIVLVATKTDLRKDPKTTERLANAHQKPIDVHQGQALAQSIGAYGYVECSAKLKDGVDDVFRKAAAASLFSRRRYKKSIRRQCVIL